MVVEGEKLREERSSGERCFERAEVRACSRRMEMTNCSEVEACMRVEPPMD